MPRRFRYGGEELWAVPRRDLLFLDDESRARAVVRELAEEPGALEAMLREAGIDPMPGTTEGDAEAELVRALASGRVVLVRTDEMPRLGRAAHDVDDPGVRGEPVIPLAPSLPIRLSIVDYTGIPYAGLVVEVDFPDGHREKVQLDKLGRWFEEHVAGPGSCRIVLPSVLRLSDEDRRRAPVDGFIATDEDLTIPRDNARPQSLALGKTHRIVVQPPPLNPSLAFRGASFAFDSAFPTPGVASMLSVLAEHVANTRRSDAAPPKFGLFGHCDPSGDVDYNKDLSDRRAKVIYALAIGDADLFDEVAEAEDWPVVAYQAMLRGLGNNPGPIDGELGPMTSAAIETFRKEYGEDAHFDNSVRKAPRRHGPLEPGDALDDATKAAVRDAYHAEFCLDLPPEYFYGPKMAGCSEFNVISDNKGENRRVTLAIWGDDAPPPGEFPCVAGDAGACTVDEGGELRCRFYREHVVDPSEIPEAFAFWDFEWTPKPSGAAHLCALTSLADTDDVEFVVEVCQGAEIEEDSGRGTHPILRGPELARVPGRIRLGIAFARWDCAPYDPFDAKQWFQHPTEETERRLLWPAYQPPVFTIVGDDAWGQAGPPGQRLGALRTTEAVSGPALALRNDGKLLYIPDIGARDPTRHPQRIIGIYQSGLDVRGIHEDDET